MVMQHVLPAGENRPRCGFASGLHVSEPTLKEPRFKVYWIPAQRMVANRSALRWYLRRVTAHVSRLIRSSTRAACQQTAFRMPLRAWEAGKLRCAVSGPRFDGAPSPASLTRLIAPDAHRCAGVGWRQARVQVSARAPLLKERLSRY